MELITTITTIIGSIIAVGGFIIGIYQYRSTVQLSTFRLYADRYNSIITSNINNKWHDSLNGNKEHWEELTPTMISYLNLIWEESYLAENGIISKTLWNIWRQEVKEVINTEFAKQIIEKYKYHFPSNLTDKCTKIT